MSRMYGIVACLLWLACTGRHAHENEYAQSVVIHNSMIRKGNEMEHAIREMLVDSLLLNNRDSLQAILSDLQAWKTQLVEVPGNESHDHASHDHETINITPEQMLLVQQSLDNALGSIAQRLIQLNMKENNETIQSR